MIEQQGNEQRCNRREFLRTVARVVLVSGAFAALLSAFRRGNQTCTGNGLCTGCASYQRCELPQALSAKAVLREKRHGI